MRTIRACALGAALLVVACAQTTAVDEARVRELEQQARTLAKTDGCDRADQCAAAPVGAKPCGGPRTYLVYCKATTDEAALMRALDELKRAEESYNRASGLMSDCGMAPQPDVRLDGRTCTAVAP
jgi:hypothetical protein